MGYIYLLIALLSNTAKGYFGKKTSEHTKNFGDAIAANGIRMALCVVIGFLIVLAGGELPALIPSGKMLLVSVISGLSMAIFVVTWLVAVRKNAYILLEVFLMLSILVPLLGSNALFGEEIRLTQWIGMLFLFVSAVLMCSYSSAIKTKMTLGDIALLLICGIAHGVSDFSQKLFAKQVPDGSAAVFNFYTYLLAGVVLLIALGATRKSGKDADKANMKEILLPVTLMAVCMFVTSFLRTLAANRLDAIVLYPFNHGGGFIMSSLMAAVVFKERLTVKAIIGIVVAFVGLLIINFL